MKPIFITVLYVLLYINIQAQTINGIVYRANSDTVIANATVYYSGTMMGTITDSKGRFEMPAKQQQIPIVVSCIGYYSGKVNYEKGKSLIVRLKPKTTTLNEVTIRVDGMNRHDEEAAFIREFIGVSPFALSCTVTNINDINLFYSKKTHILSASCDKPIIIINKKLGYTITYYLDKFEKAPKEVIFAGNYIFTENLISAKDTAKIKRNREEAYEGSRMQLIRALWSNTVRKTNFRLYTPYYDPIIRDSIVYTDSLRQKYLHFTGRVLVVNKNNTMRTNPLIQKEALSFIDKDGFYGVGILWSGELGNQRVGDLLPFEYRSQNEFIKGLMPDTANIIQPTVKTAEFADRVSKKNLTEAERNILIFKNIVLVQDNPINNRLVIKKWQQPVYYKIYGTSGDAKFDKVIADRIHNLFELLSTCSGLEIKEANDSTVNFTLLIGALPNFKKVVSNEAYRYFRNEETVSKSDYAGKKNTGYYNWSAEGFTNMIQLVETNTIGSNNLLWCQIKAQIMSGLGFFGQLGNPNSLLYRGVSYWTPNHKIEPFDSRIIKTLYQPIVKSGMTERQLDNILNGVQL